VGLCKYENRQVDWAKTVGADPTAKDGIDPDPSSQRQPSPDETIVT